MMNRNAALMLVFFVISGVWLGCSARVASKAGKTESAYSATPAMPAASQGEQSGLIKQPTGRTELINSKTPLRISETATKDPHYQTPLPVEAEDLTALLPDGLRFKLPFTGEHKITNGYGYDCAGWTHRTIGNTESANDFFALDFSMPEGTLVLAPADGRILTSNLRDDSYGRYIVIDHGRGIHTIYAHLSKLEFEVDHGEPEVWVHQGQKIAESGKSGTRWPHLHFAAHKSTTISHSGADVGGLAVMPEPLGGYYGIRRGQVLVSDQAAPE